MSKRPTNRVQFHRMIPGHYDEHGMHRDESHHDHNDHHHSDEDDHASARMYYQRPAIENELDHHGDALCAKIAERISHRMALNKDDREHIKVNITYEPQHKASLHLTIDMHRLAAPLADHINSIFHERASHRHASTMRYSKKNGTIHITARTLEGLIAPVNALLPHQKIHLEDIFSDEALRFNGTEQGHGKGR